MADHPTPAAPPAPAPAEPPVDDRPLDLGPAVPPARVEPVVVSRWIQAIALTLGLLLLWAIASAARNVVIIFVVARTRLDRYELLHSQFGHSHEVQVVFGRRDEGRHGRAE